MLRASSLEFNAQGWSRKRGSFFFSRFFVAGCVCVCVLWCCVVLCVCVCACVCVATYILLKELEAAC
jgi:hypothetical protein